MSDQIDDIFGEPALLEGEDRERYMRLYAAVEADTQPKGFFDQMLVREQTDKIWEELRLKCYSAALIDSANIEALRSLLAPIYAQSMSIAMVAKAAFQFYDADPKAKKEVAAIMAQHGITETKVHAKAMQIMGGTLQVLDRMIFSRENARRNLRKEQERREAPRTARSRTDLKKSA